MYEFIVSKLWELTGIEEGAIDMRDMFDKERFVLNQNNVWIRMLAWFNRFGAIVNLATIAVLDLIVLIGGDNTIMICSSILLFINMFFKRIVLIGFRKTCTSFDIKQIKPINILDNISFVVGYIAIIAVGVVLKDSRLEVSSFIRMPIIVFLSILVYITSIDNLHKLFTEIMIYKKYDSSKDIEVKSERGVKVYNDCQLVDDDIVNYNIICTEHSDCVELHLLSNLLGLRKTLLLVGEEKEDNSYEGIYDISLYKVITEIYANEHRINMGNIKEYL